MGLPALNAFLLTGLVEGVLYGFYVCLFIVMVYVQMWKKLSLSSQARTLFGIGMALFGLITIHAVLNFWRTYIGYVYHLTTPKGGPLAFVATLRTWHQIMKDVIYVIVSLIGDGIAVYRCWVVWQYNYYVIILPTLLFIGSIVSGFVVNGLLPQQPVGTSIFTPTLVKWVATFYAVAVIQNGLTTGLITYKVWKTARNLSGPNNLSSLLRILIESAALYFIVELMLLCAGIAKTDLLVILQDSIPAIVGITFSLITIRIALSADDGLPATENISVDDHVYDRFSIHGRDSRLPMKPLAPITTDESSYGRKSNADKFV